jgi:uncharacterized membrane protein HdeD (DUF308 family)
MGTSQTTGGNAERSPTGRPLGGFVAGNGVPPDGISRMDAMSTMLAGNWWAIALRGLAAIVFGIIALAVPGAVLLSLALIFAAYLLADGVFAIVAAVRAARQHERWALLLIEGVLDIVVGVAAAIIPAGAVLAFVFMTAAWALLTGGLMLASAFRLHLSHGRWWLALGGLVSIVWGILLAIAPTLGAVVLTWWLGGYALVFGVVLLVLAFRLRRQRDTGLTAAHS